MKAEPGCPKDTSSITPPKAAVLFEINSNQQSTNPHKYSNHPKIPGLNVLRHTVYWSQLIDSPSPPRRVTRKRVLYRMSFFQVVFSMLTTRKFLPRWTFVRLSVFHGNVGSSIDNVFVSPQATRWWWWWSPYPGRDGGHLLLTLY